MLSHVVVAVVAAVVVVGVYDFFFKHLSRVSPLWHHEKSVAHQAMRWEDAARAQTH